MSKTYKSWCITIRPKKGLSNETCSEVVKWLGKQQYAHGVVEEEEEAKHLHAQIWCVKERRRGEVMRSVKRICERTIEEWNSAQTKVLSGGIRIAYSDWYESYLLNAEKKKDKELRVIIDNVPDKTEEYYPSEQEQEELIASKNATDSCFHSDDKAFWKWWISKGNLLKRIEIEHVAEFLGEGMFKTKVLKVVQDKGKAMSRCQTLFFYITGRYTMNHFMTKDELEKWGFREELRRRMYFEKINGTNDHD